MNCRVYFIHDDCDRYATFRYLIETINLFCKYSKEVGCPSSKKSCSCSLFRADFIDGNRNFIDEMNEKYAFDDDVWNRPDKYSTLEKEQKDTLKFRAAEQLIRLYSDANYLLKAAIDPHSILITDVRLAPEFKKYGNRIRQNKIVNNKSVVWEKAAANELLYQIKSGRKDSYECDSGDFKIRSKDCELALEWIKNIKESFEENEGITNDGNIAAAIIGVRAALKLPTFVVSNYIEENNMQFVYKEKEYELEIPLLKLEAAHDKTKKDKQTPFNRDICNAAEKIIDRANRIFAIHKDPNIDKALKIYGSICEKYGSVAWRHDHMSADNVEIKEDYEKTITNWLGVKIQGDCQKALFMSPNTNGYRKNFKYQNDDLMFFNIGDDPHYGIKGKDLKVVLRKLGIDADKSLSNLPYIRFPVAPGIPFLISLREFLWRLEGEGSALSVVFEQYKNEHVQNYNLYGILIVLKKERDKLGEETCQRFELSQKYKDANDAKHNTSRSLKNLSYARIDPVNPRDPFVALKQNKDWLDLFTEEKHNSKYRTKDNKIEVISSPCVGICFYPFGFRLIWATRS